MKKIFFLLFTLFSIQSSFAQFQKKIITGIPQLNNTNSCSGDINHDGLIDLVLMGEEADHFVTSVYINKTDHFSPLLIPEMKNLSNGSISLVDFNNDNFLDLFITGNTKSGNKHSMLFKNSDGNSFHKVDVSFQNVDYSSQTWLDFNNDGFLDLVLSGLNEANEITTQLYVNNKNETFTPQDSDLVQVYSGAIKTVDYNNDSYTDILIMGITLAAKRVSYLYRNDENGKFTKVIELEGLSNGDAEWADYNKDGYQDLAIAGYDGTDYQAKIYTNKKGTLHFLQDLDYKLGNSDLEWINYDGDEDLDLIHTGGVNNTSPKTVLYQNNGTNFVETTELFDPVYLSCLSIADFDMDGKKDIFLSGAKIPEGPFSSFYFNKNIFTLPTPIVPGDTKASVNYPNVTLQWSVKDATGKSINNLKYRLKIGSSDDDSYFFPFPTDIEHNRSLHSKTPQLSAPAITIKNLSEGKYYWAVQSVDINGTVSDLSPSRFFYVNAPYSLGEDKNICIKDEVELNVVTGNYTVDWIIDAKNIINKNTIRFTVEKEEEVVVKLNKNYGGTVYDTIKINCKLPKTLHLPETVSSCYQESVILKSDTNDETSTWFNFSNDILAKTKNYEFTNTQKDSVILKVETKFGCISYDTCKITVNELPVIDLKEEYFSCKNDVLEITCNDFSKIEWLSSDRNILLKNSQHFQQKVSATHDYFLKVEDKNGCSSEKEFRFTPYELPTAIAGRDTLVCKGSSVLIGPNIMAEGGNAPYEYSWNPSEKLNNSRSHHPEFIANENSEFILRVTDQNNCQDTDTVNYQINPVSTIDIGQDQTICKGESVQLGGNPTAQNSLRDYQYTWEPSIDLDDPNSSNPTASPSVSTEYTLQVRTHTCEAYTKKVKVLVNDIPSLTSISDTTVGANEKFQLWVKGAERYSWSPANFLDDAESEKPSLELRESTTFTVIGFSALGCESEEKTVQVSINNELFIPTLFTPNGDGKNDLFLVYATGISDLKLRIYNNYGSVLFQSNDSDQIRSSGWDGTNAGKNAPEGNYIWELEGKYSDGRYWRKTGTIYLMR